MNSSKLNSLQTTNLNLMKMTESSANSVKSNFSVSHSAFKTHVQQTCKNYDLFGKELDNYSSIKFILSIDGI